MTRQLSFDVVVVGGGTAGIAAAVGAARAGAKTLLLERNAYLGGVATHTSVAAFCGFYTAGNPPRKVVGGVGDMVLSELSALGQETNYEISASGNATIKFHPDYLKLALDRLLEQNGVHLLLHARVIEAHTRDGLIQSLLCTDDAGKFAVEGEMFVDATGDGNLSFLSGARVTGDDPGQEKQLAAMTFRIDGIGPDADLSLAAIEKAVRQAKRDGVSPLTREAGVTIQRTGWDYAYVLLPSTVLESIDAQALTDAERYLRRQVHAYLHVFRTYMRGLENCRLVTVGPAMGIRESRRQVGKYRLTREDVLSARAFAHTVGRGGWNPEIHIDPVQCGKYLKIAGRAYYDIPLDALRSADIENLLGAGRLVSSDDVAFASVRVMGTAFVTGHAAGVAAAVAVAHGQMEIGRIQDELIRQGAMI